MKKIKSKNFKSVSIVFVILWIKYLWVWYLARYVVSVNKVCHQENCFIVEVAATDQQRELWLMNREKLWNNKWMIFVFEEEGNHPFWMKNTLIPLDMIWIDYNWTIVDIQTAQPCETNICPTYTPKWNAKYVLEINAWMAEERNIEIWEEMKLKLK